MDPPMGYNSMNVVLLVEEVLHFSKSTIIL